LCPTRDIKLLAKRFWQKYQIKTIMIFKCCNDNTDECHDCCNDNTDECHDCCNDNTDECYYWLHVIYPSVTDKMLVVVTSHVYIFNKYWNVKPAALTLIVLLQSLKRFDLTTLAKSVSKVASISFSKKLQMWTTCILRKNTEWQELHNSSLLTHI